MMDLHAYNVENIVTQYTSDVKVGHSDVAGKPEDSGTGFQCLRQPVNIIFASQGI